MEFEEKTIATREIHKGRIIDVREDTVIMPDGSTALRELVAHHGGVGVIAVTDERDVFMVSQYRIAARCMMLEIPAGKLEKDENNPEAAGRRELTEETGYEAKDFQYLGAYYATPGYCEEKLHLYLARNLTYKGQHLDDGEFLNVHKMKLDKLYEMVMNNEIIDAKTAIAILKAKAILG